MIVYFMYSYFFLMFCLPNAQMSSFIISFLFEELSLANLEVGLLTTNSFGFPLSEYFYFIPEELLRWIQNSRWAVFFQHFEKSVPLPSAFHGFR